MDNPVLLLSLVPRSGASAVRRGLTALALAAVAAPAAPAQEGDDRARRRWEAFHQRRAFPFERIPPGAREAAWRHARTLRTEALFGAPPPVSGTEWRSLGPFSVPIHGTSAGRITAVAVHPSDLSTIYVGAALGGVWKTTDGGASWIPLTDGECSLAIGAIALDPVDPDIIYVGTGEHPPSFASYFGCGVLRSTDGGTTWTQLGTGVFTGSRISEVGIVAGTAGDPATTTLFAATDVGLLRSLDGGATWTEVLERWVLACSSCPVTDLAVHPEDDQVLYAAVRGRGVYKSVDGGMTWVRSGTGAGFPGTDLGDIKLALAVPGSDFDDFVYAAVRNQQGDRLLGIWRTTDGGASWHERAAAGISCCGNSMHITLHPFTPFRVYVGGSGLYQSVDGAATFSEVTGPMSDDQRMVVFAPQDHRIGYAATGTGIYRSVNSGSSWPTSLSEGLVITEFHEGISLHPSDWRVILGGAQAVGTVEYAGRTEWQQVLGGDGGFTAIDRDDPTIRYAEMQWFGPERGPQRSDGGAFVLKATGINRAEMALYIPPLVMDPSVSSTLYFGTDRIYRTTDQAETWTVISPDLGWHVSAITPAPSDPYRIYVGMSSSQLYVTEDGGGSWDQRTTGLPGRFVEDIAVDPIDPLTAYVVFSGFGEPHVFRTADGGLSWSNVSGFLPDVPVNAVVLDPADRGFVMVGTDVGVFVSADSGRSWLPVSDGMPSVPVVDLAYNPVTASLVAATHGRGMFALQLEDRPLTLGVWPASLRDTITAGTTVLSPDSVAVVLTGPGSDGAGWTATHSAGATWITPGVSSGVSSGFVTWTRDPTGLVQGVHVDSITVSAAGAEDSPLLVLDSLVIAPPRTVAVSPPSRSDTITEGEGAVRTDSASVQLAGVGADTATWAASAVRGGWITVTTPSGSGPGTLSWNRTGGWLPPGVHVDTIAVTATDAVGSPALVVDSLVVEFTAAAFAATVTRDTAVSGSPESHAASVRLLLLGGQDSTTAWTASHTSASWVSLRTTEGQGSQIIEWARRAEDLVDGTYVDTITVVTAAGDTARVFDLFTVVEPVVSRACLSEHLLGSACLDAVQRRWLDLAGNADGALNLGDVVALFERGGPVREGGTP